MHAARLLARTRDGRARHEARGCHQHHQSLDAHLLLPSPAVADAANVSRSALRAK
jgi:hypothetical protein